MSSHSTLRPQITVPLESGNVVARDLPWQDALEFLKKLSVHANTVLAASKGGTVQLDTLLPRIAELIGNADDLALFLICKSTGKDEAWVRSLGTIEALTVLDAALEVNLSDQLLALGKKVAGRLARVMPAKTPTSDLPSPATS